LILSIETSTEVCSIALHNKRELIASDTSTQPYSHAERLAPMIQELFKTSAVEKNRLSAVAVSAGPGSYTGLRIGTSTAKGLAYALDIPLITVNTLHSMLLNLPEAYAGHLRCPMIDARRMEVYCLLANDTDKILEEVQAKIIDGASFSHYLETQKILFYGNGAAKCAPIINSTNGLYLNEIVPSAVNIGELAWEKYQQGDFADLAYFEPDYLKPYLAIKAKNPLL